MNFKLLVAICIIALCLGCADGQRMMKSTLSPMEDVSAPVSTVPDEIAVVEEPTISVDYEIDGIVNSHEVFTSAHAALNSEQFEIYLKYCEEYNTEFCGKMVKRGLSVDVNELFEFYDRTDAVKFSALILQDYSDVFSDPPLNNIESVPGFPWYIVRLYPRCF